MPTIRISDDTANVLKKLARPLEDTWDSYLSRAGRFILKRESEFLAFEAGGISDDEKSGGDTGARQAGGNPKDLDQAVRGIAPELGHGGRTSGTDGTSRPDAVPDDYTRTEKIKWVIEHMGSWISRPEFLRQAERAFPETPTTTLIGTIAQAWTDCTNPKFDAPFRRRGVRGEERRFEGVHEKRLVPI
jgi:hypothetical protein